MKKIIFVLLIVFGLSSCGTAKISTTNQKVSKEGILKVKSGENYLLQTDNGIVNITSNKVNLDNYLKKNIKATGMFSGDTLYTDTVEER